MGEEQSSATQLAIAEKAAAASLESISERATTREEYYYLLSRYPYLEICDTDYPYIDPGTVPDVIVAPNGWRIYDYGSVLASGCYELMASIYAQERSDEEGGEGGEGGGHGTIVQQYADIAALLIAMAMGKEWAKAEVISGYYPMQRMAWIAAKAKGYTLKGFYASSEDHVVDRWVSSLRNGSLYPPSVSIIPSDRLGGVNRLVV